QTSDYESISSELQLRLSSALQKLCALTVTHEATEESVNPCVRSALLLSILAGTNHAMSAVLADDLPLWDTVQAPFKELWETLDSVAEQFERRILPKGPEYLRKIEEKFLGHLNGSAHQLLNDD